MIVTVMDNLEETMVKLPEKTTTKVVDNQEETIIKVLDDQEEIMFKVPKETKIKAVDNLEEAAAKVHLVEELEVVAVAIKMVKK
jgi:hypothetical protein